MTAEEPPVGPQPLRDFEAEGMWANLGARLTETRPGLATVEANLTAEQHGFPTARGTIVHGGATAALADMALASAAMTLAEAGETVSTSDLKVDYFRPARPGRLRAHAEVRHRSRRLAYCQASVEQEDGSVVAEARAVLAYLSLERPA